MSHFVEEAEQKEKSLKKKEEIISSSVPEIISSNKQLYSSFHNLMEEYIQKIASLSSESRRPVVEIGYTYLEGDFKYEYYASSYKTITKRVLLFIKKEKVYTVWRRCIVTITEKKGILKLTMYEKAVSEKNLSDVIKKKQRVYIKIDDLNREFALWLIDFLGYKYSQREIISHIPHKANIQELV
ncbi:MAG: hypothetical protein GYA62_16650 [Bacteroidales bacterium]|nr:hypothetical protein [Bacteroidales bacterium]